MSFTLRRAVPRDFLGIAALDRVVWTGAHDQFIPDGEHVWRVWCEYARVLVAESGALPAGPWSPIAGAALTFPTVDGELFLHKIFVHSACAGLGIGTALLQAMLEEAGAPVLLTVNPANERALALYRKLGFAVRAEVQGYYRAEEDRLVMVWDEKMQNEMICVRD
ncbi:MAG: GNAT family N-acetyltransferase [Armatimonadota bacterium]